MYCFNGVRYFHIAQCSPITFKNISFEFINIESADLLIYELVNNDVQKMLMSPSVKYGGISNLGATCYISGALQVIFSVIISCLRQ